MSTNHTPRPWTQHHNMPDCVTFEGKHGAENLFLENSRGYYACQSKEDASLISAAPELLAALKYYRDECSGREPSISVFLRMMEEAIAKAEGVSI